MRRKPALIRTLQVLNLALVLVMNVAYGTLLLTLMWHRDVRFLPCLLVPAVSFVLLSVVRHFINRPRPYETWSIDPLIAKDTSGNSMPSRHVFSSVIIAMTWLWITAPVGVALLIVSVIAAAIRVVGGVHYVSDVAVGYAVGVVAGIVLFFL